MGGRRFVFLRFKTNYLKANVCMCVCVFVPFVLGKFLRQRELREKESTGRERDGDREGGWEIERDSERENRERER